MLEARKMRADDEEAAAANDEARGGDEREGSRVLQARCMTTISVEKDYLPLGTNVEVVVESKPKISVSSQTMSSATFFPKGKMRCNRSKRVNGIWSYLFCSFRS